MKRLIAGLGAGIALAIPAVVAAATPTSGQTYMEQARSAHLVAIGTYSSRGLSESRNSGPYLSGPGPNVGKCNNRYQWIIGDKPYQRPIRVTSAGYWSATRVNQASLNPGRSPKVTVTDTSRQRRVAWVPGRFMAARSTTSHSELSRVLRGAHRHHTVNRVLHHVGTWCEPRSGARRRHGNVPSQRRQRTLVLAACCTLRAPEKRLGILASGYRDGNREERQGVWGAEGWFVA